MTETLFDIEFWEQFKFVLDRLGTRIGSLTVFIILSHRDCGCDNAVSGEQGGFHPHTPAYTHTRFSTPFIGYLPINLIYSSMPVQDRTNEFLACVESIRNRSSLPVRNTDKQRLLDKQARADTKSEFARMASAIGKDISSTTTKLGKLAQCALPYPLFRVAEPLTALL